MIRLHCGYCPCRNRSLVGMAMHRASFQPFTRRPTIFTPGARARKIERSSECEKHQDFILGGLHVSDRRLGTEISKAISEVKLHHDLHFRYTSWQKIGLERTRVLLPAENPWYLVESCHACHPLQSCYESIQRPMDSP